MDNNESVFADSKDQLWHPRNLVVFITRVDERMSEHLQAALRKLMEVSPTAISGFYDDFRIVNKVVQYDEAKPYFRYDELYGRAIGRAFQSLARQYSEEGVTFDILVVEPDITGYHAVAAWHCKNMAIEKLQGPGAEKARHDPDVTHIQSDICVSFTCETERNVEELASSMLKQKQA